jgi:hypothetical protein
MSQPIIKKTKQELTEIAVSIIPLISGLSQSEISNVFDMVNYSVSNTPTNTIFVEYINPYINNSRTLNT